MQINKKRSMKKIKTLMLSTALFSAVLFLLNVTPTVAVIEVEQETVSEESALRIITADDETDSSVVETDEEDSALMEDSGAPLLDMTAGEADDENDDITSAASVETFNTEMSRFQVAGLDLQAGNVLKIYGDSDKDIIAAAAQISIEDTVAGDVFAACNDFTLNGAVQGSVRVAANTVTIDGPVTGNLLIFASTIRLTENADIGGHANIYGASITHEGIIEKTAHMGAGFVTVNGTLNNSATIEAQTVEFADSALLEEEVLVKSPVQPTVDSLTDADNYIVYEKTEFSSSSDMYRPEQLAGLASFFIIFRIIHVLFWSSTCLLLGILFIIIWPKWSTRVAGHMKESAGKTWLTGALFFFLAPIAGLILTVTVIGIPFAVLLSAVYAALFFLGRILVGLFIGRLILKPKDSDTTGKKVLQFFLGYIIITILLIIPVFGWFISAIVALWGMGGIIHLFLEDRAEPQQKKGEEGKEKKKPVNKKEQQKETPDKKKTNTKKNKKAE